MPLSPGGEGVGTLGTGDIMVQSAVPDTVTELSGGTDEAAEENEEEIVEIENPSEDRLARILRAS